MTTTHTTSSLARRPLFLALAATFALAACDDAAGIPGDPLAPGELAVVEPGGETLCSRGTPYRFAALGGDPRRLVIDFAGGGACWNEMTCSIAGAVFSEDAPSTTDFEAFARLEGGLSGHYDRAHPENPVAGWTLVHVSYCTGDIHLGDATHTYGDDLTIAHRGYRNATSVLDWAEAHYPAAEQIHVTGCSAGAYGAIAYTKEIRRRWPRARLSVLADSGAGVVTDEFSETAFDTWNVWNAVDVDTLEAVYAGTASALPDTRIAQFTAAHDVRQSFYYNIMGGDDDWTERLFGSLASIGEAAPGFRSYVAPGPGHCIVAYPSFYTRDAGVGTPRFVTWLSEFIHGAELPDSVACDDSTCREDAVCDACAAGSEAPECRFCDGWR